MNRFVLLLVVPLVLLVIYLLPLQLKEDYLILKTTSPTLLSIITSNYVHIAQDHLFSNVAVYMISVLSIALMGELHRITPMLLVSLLIVIPAILSAINLLILPANVALGFSGVSSAFVGLFLCIACLHVRDFWGVKDIYPVLLIILGINTLFLALTNPQLPENHPLFFMIILVVLAGLVAVNVRTISAIFSYVWNKSLKSRNNLLLYVLGALQFFVSVLLLFFMPFIVVLPQPGVPYLVNTIAHYLGYMMGLVFGLLLCR